MPSVVNAHGTIVGRRMRALREQLGWSQEQVGVAVGLDESSSRARISRYELGVHEPAVKTARLIAQALDAPLAYLFTDDDELAALLLTLHRLPPDARKTALRSLFRAIRTRKT